MFKWLFGSKKKKKDFNEIDDALTRFHHRESQFTSGSVTRAPTFIQNGTTEDTELDDIVETAILVAGVSSLLDSIGDCNDIEVVDSSSSTDTSDWSGDGGGFSGGGASDDF